MQSIIKLFDVIQYENESLFIVASIKRGSGKKDLFITKEEFNAWMLKTGRLDLQDNHNNSADSYAGAEGTGSIEDYWQKCNNEQVKADLYEFISKELLIPAISCYSSSASKMNKRIKRISNIQMPAFVIKS